ncbi:MAG: FecR domain-containing protein [Rudaea sp.]|nr:FecR domain-containing protein [Rudaea sp.]
MTPPRPSRAAYAEAAAWLAQLHGAGRDADLEADFRAWLKAGSGDHARAFERVTEIWDTAGQVDIRGLARVAAPSARERKPPRWRLAAAALVLSALGLGVFLLLPRGVQYTTGMGEQRSVRLNDGTRLSMNQDSAVDVDYGARERIVHLSRGEVLFEVAHDAQHPFVVLVGDRTVTALGTSFVVRKEPDEMDVTLLEGKVSVASLSAAKVSWAVEKEQGAITLKPGQYLRVRAGERPQLDVRRADAATAWRRGEVILDGTPLGEAVAEMNRYDPRRVQIDDADLGQVRVSGIYRTGDNLDFAQSVASIYGLKVKEEAGHIRLTRQ